MESLSHEQTWIDTSTKEKILEALASNTVMVAIKKFINNTNNEVSPADLEELSNDVLLNAIEAVNNNKFKYGDNILPLLNTIAQRRAIDLGRRRQVMLKHGFKDEVPTGYEAPSEEPNPEQVLINRENDTETAKMFDTKKIKSAINKLPEPYRKIMKLILEGKKQKDIAVDLGKSERTIIIYVNDARRKLKEILKLN